MKNLGTKKNIFILSTLTTLFVGVLFTLDSNYCYLNPFCIDSFIVLFLIPPFLFLLSLITYKMKDHVFRAWWNFAWWWSLLIVGVTFLLTHAQGGGTLGMNQDFTFFVLSILYVLLVIVSLYRIARASRVQT